MCEDRVPDRLPAQEIVKLPTRRIPVLDDKLPTDSTGLTDMRESTSSIPNTRCLEHQLPEDQPSPLGLVCRACHARLLQDPPSGPCRGFWESQPVNDSNGEACAVFTLAWDDFQIRSQHPATGWDDLERAAQEVLASSR